MMELPESRVLARQLNDTTQGKSVRGVTLGASPHKFFFTNKEGPPLPDYIEGRTLGRATPLGIYVEIEAEDNTLLLGEGMSLRFIAPGEQRPKKHQLLIEFEDDSALSGGVQMYGGAWAFRAGSFQNPYYLVAKEKPSPYTEAFNWQWFQGIVQQAKPTLSAKALLATEQRIPGLGNGVLQDILFRTKLHPKTKIKDIPVGQMETLFHEVKDTLAQMDAKGGRDTEKDLFGCPGGYETLLSAKTWKNPCPACGGEIQKQQYLGGSVYFCPHCQPL